jgi:hypothetical protein
VTGRSWRRLALWLACAVGLAAAGWWTVQSLAEKADRLDLDDIGYDIFRDVRFELSPGGLPSIEPRASIYRVIRKGISVRQAETIAKKCGIHARVKKYSRWEAIDRLVASDGRLEFRAYREPGCISFMDIDRWGMYETPIGLPDDAEAVRMARSFLRKCGVMPHEDATLSPSVWASNTRGYVSKETGKHVNEAYGLGVGFRRRLSGHEVTGRGGVKVEIAYDGKPAGFQTVSRPVEKQRDADLIGVEAAYGQLAEHNAAWDGPDTPGTARVESVRLIYWERPPGLRQLLLEPIYEFKGTFLPNTDDTEPKPFKARVLAVRNGDTRSSDE